MTKLYRVFAGLALLVAVQLPAKDEPPVDAAFGKSAAAELGQLLEATYLYPQIGRRYSEALKAQSFAEIGSLTELAHQLEGTLRQVHNDAHLRVMTSNGGASGAVRRSISGGRAVGRTQRLGDRVAYLELLGLPGDQSAQQAMADFLDSQRGAEALIIDARRCPGGGLPVIDVLASRLYAEPRHLLNMEMRADADAGLQADFDALSSLRRVSTDPDRVRWEHWATPNASPADRAWSEVPVYLLTDFTASACEHLALALKSTGRATLVGKTTRGAGHFGSLQDFADGRLHVFLPVGRTFDPATGEDWEGSGVDPDEAVPAADALAHALTLFGADPALAQSVAAAAPTPSVAVREQNPRGRSYGIGMLPPRGGETSLEILQIRPDGPAAAAGLRSGDHIVSINGTAVAELDAAAIGQAMRGSPLQLSYRRGDAQSDVTLVW